MFLKYVEPKASNSFSWKEKKPCGRLWEVVEELKQKKKAEAEAAGQEVAPEEDLVGAATTAEEAAEVYIRHVARRVLTPAVRGRACASAERVTEEVLQDVDVATADPVNPEKILTLRGRRGTW